MALTTCSACDAQVSTTATKCPQCGHRLRKPKRGFFGRLFKWGFVLFNILMIVWLFAYLGELRDVMTAQTDEYGQAGAAIGGTLGVGFILVLWAIVDIILGMLVLFTRARD